MTTENTIAGPLPELDALGVRYNMEYGNARSHFVRNVCIPWTPSQWVGVLHREGQWLGTCCGNISSIRDYLMQVLADGGWLDPKRLQDIILLLESHDGFMDWFADGFTPDPDTLANPLYLLVQVWSVVKNKRWASWVDVPPKQSAEKLAEHSGRSLERALMYYNIMDKFHAGEYSSEEYRVEAQFRHDRDAMLSLSRVLSSLKMFNDSIKDRVLDPLLGLAIVRKENREVVLETGVGLAIYHDEASAKEIVGFWCTNDQDNYGEGTPKVEDFETRRVRVSLENGIEFLDP